jgi:NitT/TauT family transport system ATP-binding protein
MNHVAESSEVVLDRVSKSYAASCVLDQCTFDIPAGSFTTLVGPSGCGKTTIINLIAGYDWPDAGRVTVSGRPVAGPGWDRLVVFQETALFPWMTTIDNVIFGLQNRGVRRHEAEVQAHDLLAKFGLRGFERKYPSQLSGGMQRRAELARAMINSPQVMLFDEAFRGLDTMTRGLMQEYLLGVFEENPITTLFVTTEIEEAIYLADRVVVLSGRPTSTKETISIDLPRPRKLEMLSSAQFGAIHERILSSLIEEAGKAFSEGAEPTEMLTVLRGQ